ncbi:bridge-like lipid transfer protein family member 3B [Glandiceps talaboti]
MAGLLKKQITKHLSKFAKNLSPDKINISTLKGEGELHNLELNEEVLMDLMDLPLWIVLTKAKCNKVSFKIPWTKIKTTPAHIHLDRVEVEMRVVQEFRTSTDSTPLHSSGGKYSLSDRLIDGLYVSVNEIVLDFRSHAFHASILMSQFSIRSTTPDWEYTNDLHNTRIKDKNSGELLNFKQAYCQTLRINVDALRNERTTPILLITYEPKIRFAVKKKLEDCSVLTSQVRMVLTDILLVLTDSQLKAAIEFIQMLGGLNQKAQDLVKADKNILSQSRKQESKAKDKNEETQRTADEHYFDKYDIVESSYHMSMERLNMHLVDEQNRSVEETFKRRTEGGAMKINITNLSVDLYPYHVYNTDRSHWTNSEIVSDTMEKRDTWAKHLLADFRQKVKAGRDQGRLYLQDVIAGRYSQRGQSSEMSRPRTNSEVQGHPPSQRPQTVGYSRNMDVLQVNRPRSQSDVKNLHQSRGPQPVKGQHGEFRGHPQPQTRSRRQPQLMENCMILKVEDFAIFAVSTEGSKDVNKKFFYSDKAAFSLPDEMSSLYVEATSYYFPEGLEFPVPEPNMYCEVNPLRLDIDYITVLWINQFANLMASGVQMKSDTDSETGSSTGSTIGSDMDHVNIRVDALMPKIVIPAEEEVTGQPERPNALQVQFSQVILSNCRIGTSSSISDLASAVQNIYGGKLFTNQQSFPNESGDLNAVPQMLWNHAYKSGESDIKDENSSAPIAVQGKGTSPPPQTTIKSEKNKKEPMGKRAFFKSASEDVWCVHCDQVWVDFLGVENAKGRPVPFIESLPLVIWVCLPPKEKTYEGSEAGGDTPNLITAEMTFAEKRKLYGHRKAASMSYSLNRSLSPPTSPDSGELSASLSNLSSSQRSLDHRIPYSHSSTSLTSTSFTSSHTSGITMASSDIGISPVSFLGRSDSFSSSTTSDSALGSIPNSHIPSTFLPSSASIDSSESKDDNIADRHFIAETKDKLRVMLTRPQFLFLMRLLDSLTKMSDAIEEDIEMFQGKSDKVSSMVIAARLHAAEVTLVLPPILEPDDDDNDDEKDNSQEHPNMQEDGCLSSHSNSNDTIHSEDVTEDQKNTVKSPDDSEKLDSHGNEHDQTKLATNTLPGGSTSENQVIGGSVTNQDSGFELLDLDEVHIGNGNGLMEETISFSKKFNRLDKDEEKRQRTSSKDGNSTTMRAEQNPVAAVSLDNIPGSNHISEDNTVRWKKGHEDEEASNSASQVIGQNLSTMLHSEKFNNTQTNKPILSNVDSESSLRDLLDNSDQDASHILDSNKSQSLTNLLVEEEGVQVQQINTLPSETQNSPETNVQHSEETETKQKVKNDVQSEDMVPILNIEISDLQAAVQLFGDKTGIKLALGKVLPEELGSFSYKEFIEHRISESNKRKQSDLSPLPKSEDPVVGLRLSMGPAAEKYSPGASKHLGVRVNGLDTQVLMTSLTSLVNLIEDEKKGNELPMPIDVSVTQANIKLMSTLLPRTEDTNTVNKETDKDDIDIQEGLSMSEAPSEGAPSSVASSPPEDTNSQATSSTEEVNPLLEEVQQLRDQLDKTRSALSSVELERASLLKSLVKLQDELIDVERERESMRQEVVRLKTLKRSSSTLSLK